METEQNEVSVEAPLVSVIIPTYSRPTNLCRAIESVLYQTYSNIEIIVVDDNGKGTEFQKRTEELLANYVNNNQIIYVIHETNKNGSSARNTGFRLSHGEYIAFLDDDDQYMVDKISKQVAYLEGKDSKVGACFCNTRCLTQIYPNGFDTQYTLEGNLIKELLLSKIICNTSAILFRRCVIEELDGFNESYARHQDFELLVRFFRKYIISCVPCKPLLILDWRGERTNNPKPDCLNKIENKFYHEFEEDLKRNSIWHDLHCLWMLNISRSYFIQRRFMKGFKYLLCSTVHKSLSHIKFWYAAGCILIKYGVVYDAFVLKLR